MPFRRTFVTILAVSGGLLTPGAARAATIPALRAPEVQERLMRLGLLEDEARTGRYDRATSDAVARFQARAGHPLDGVPAQRTADRLLAAT
jgi:murein L,D-transpeptidase YcbB/YkuD